MFCEAESCCFSQSYPASELQIDWIGVWGESGVRDLPEAAPVKNAVPFSNALAAIAIKDSGFLERFNSMRTLKLWHE